MAAEVARMPIPPIGVPMAGGPPILLPGSRIPGMELMPTPPKPGALYVGDLAPEVNETVLLEKFAPIGTITLVRVCRDLASGNSLGYAYVNFQNYSDAERARNTLNYEPLRGKPMRIMFSNRDPAGRKSGLGNIFIKKLHPSVDSKTLHDTFAQFGRVLSCMVRTDEKGESRGFGYVNFETEEAAQLAVTSVDGMIIAEMKVSVMKFVPKWQRASTNSDTNFTNVYVRNLAPSTTEDQFKAMFAAFGEITSSCLQRDSQSRTYGFVNFATNESAVNAINNMNGKEVEGKELFCARAMKKTERSTYLKRQHEQRRREQDQKSQHLNLFVKNLDDDIDDTKLREAFAPFGTVVSAKVMRDPVSNLSRGFGFVSFETPEEVTKAMTDMNSRIISTKPLYVALHQRKAERAVMLAAQRQRAAFQNMYFPQMPPFGGFPRGPAPYMMGPRNMPPGMMPMMPSAYPPPQAFQQRPPFNPNFRRNHHHHHHHHGGPSNAGQGPRVNNRPNPALPQMPMPGMQEPLTASALAAASDSQRKTVLGERLYPKILQHHGELAGKITGMLLDMDNSELLHLLEDDTALREKAAEAVAVLREFENKQGRTASA